LLSSFAQMGLENSLVITFSRSVWMAIG